MKEKSVRLSGVVYVKDPRDVEALNKLRVEVRDLKQENRTLLKKLAPLGAIDRIKKELRERAKKLAMLESILRQRHDTIQRLRKMRLDTFVQGRQGFLCTQNDVIPSLIRPKRKK